MMKPFVLLAVVLAAGISLVASDVADAKRLGAGRSLGTQRQSIAPPSATPAPTQSGAASNPVMPAQPGAASAARPTAPATGASRWLGPLAGIAAGIGLAALLSHFGLSESFASILLLALLAFGAVFLVRMLFARRAVAGAPQISGRFPTTIDAPGPATRERIEPVLGGAANGVAPTPLLPPGFNPAPFLQQAKAQFRRLQAAYDTDDREVLADVMTQEMFVEVARDLDQRGAHVATEIATLDADVLEVATEGRQHVASVRFTAMLREDGDAQPKSVIEVWNLVKPVDGSSGWLLAGIQQPEPALTLQ